jgi:hypothetical protein
VAYLELLQELGKGLVVDCRTETGFTTWMTLVAVGHEHRAATLSALIECRRRR